jgi:excinuclease ABC subunit A
VTEVYDYLRLLWARIGTPHCPKCGREIKQQSIDQMTDQIMAMPEGTRIQILAPVIRARKGEHTKVFEDAKKSGYVRARVDGSMYELGETIELDKNKKHSIEIIVDRIIVRDGVRQRLTDSMETALALAGGIAIVNLIKEEKDVVFSQNYACEVCGISIEELAPRMFSFNTPYGACPTCLGLGFQLKADPGHDNPRQIAFDNGRGDNSQRLGQHTRRQYRAHVLRGAGEAVSFFTLNAR